MCQQMGVSRSGYYAWKGRPESKRNKADRALAEVVTAVHQQSRGRYGSPRVHAELRARGQRVSRKRVARLMRQQNIAARKKRRFVRTTDSRHHQPVAPNVLERNFSPGQPNKHLGHGHYLRGHQAGLALPGRGTRPLLSQGGGLVDEPPEKVSKDSKRGTRAGTEDLELAHGVHPERPSG